ncbi:MAG: DNA replication/repair protein RecF [Oscillospiraceae bacterium]|nr:DNA replication/repair protein RecF [Oscillospiraceae bacterium]
MNIEKINLVNFRNYKNLNIDFSSKINMIIGDNGEGKTNILESIYLLSYGKSHRTRKDKELINWNKEYLYIESLFKTNRLDKFIEFKIFKDGKKAININKIKVSSISELIGVINVVFFSPEDLKIVKDSPNVRRKFLDLEISKLKKKYYIDLVNYNKVLDEKNTLIKMSKNIDLKLLDIYDYKLAELSYNIINARLWYLANLNKYGKQIHKDITNSKEDIKFIYENDTYKSLSVENLYEKNVKNRNIDFIKGYTTFGPHRDDFQIDINNFDARSFASQGQQRTAVLTIKFAAIEIIKKEAEEYPILLLDDVLSELDSNRQNFIIQSMKNIQTLITSTEIGQLKSSISDLKLYLVDNANITILNDH